MYNSSWYHSLNFPPLSPPDWLFAPVWIMLYIFIFISLAFYILSQEENKEMGYINFVIQLLLNILWTPIFFGAKSILGGLIVIILLDIFVFLTVQKFCKASKWACVFMIPYFIWILFATYLNIGFLILN